uniref:TNFR-Cys domain-containing protein n=2 Tax=Latimeria chalumnae TaxID=7897 RepID=M3XKL0_LATCH
MPRTTRVAGLFSIVVSFSVYGRTQLDTPTFNHWDSTTGQLLTCNQCPPGQYLTKHCSVHHQTHCASCPADHYTQVWNYIEKCQYCNNFCKRDQYVKHECNATHNRVCECKEGFYWYFEFCMKHSECPSEYGVRVKGTPYANTVCEKCPHGFFSLVSSSTEPCRTHTDCEAQGLKVDV